MTIARSLIATALHDHSNRTALTRTQAGTLFYVPIVRSLFLVLLSWSVPLGRSAVAFILKRFDSIWTEVHRLRHFGESRRSKYLPSANDRRWVGSFEQIRLAPLRKVYSNATLASLGIKLTLTERSEMFGTVSFSVSLRKSPYCSSIIQMMIANIDHLWSVSS